MKAQSTWLLCAIVLVAVLAPLIAPFEPAVQFDIVQLRNQPPSTTHLLGTDAYARDLFSRLLHGARISLYVASVATLLALGIGLAWGALAALVGEHLGSALMAFADVLRSIPRVLLFLGIAAVAGRLGTTGVAIALGVSSWPASSRIMHVLMQQLLSRPFTEAARALGVTRWRTIVRHVVPHLSGPMCALGALLLADMLAIEAGLSFIGLGVRAPVASWGNMLHDALPYVRSAWWVAAAPCAMLVTTVLAVARLADAFADHSAAVGTALSLQRAVAPARSARLLKSMLPVGLAQSTAFRSGERPT